MKPRSGIRYVTPKGSESGFQSGSRGRVLLNILGIKTKREMDRVEFEALVKVQEQYTQRVGADTRFTVASIRDMHRAWLGGIYSWAGEYRNVELQKGRFKWPPAYLVERNMATFEAGLLTKNTPCQSGTVQEVARRIAEVHAEFLLIHPFRDGNGRVARWLADLMALQAGLPAPEYRFEGKGQLLTRATYLASVTQGYAQNYEPLTAFFSAAILERLKERV